jgi:hypothetical protein
MGSSASSTLRAAAAASLVLALYLLLSSWDGLYETLDLPQGLPALTAQIGGAGMLGLAYLLWAAAARPELAPIAARGGAIAHGAAAVVIALWLIFRDKPDIGVETAGIVILVVAAVTLGALAIAQARVGR